MVGETYRKFISSKLSQGWFSIICYRVFTCPLDRLPYLSEDMKSISSRQSPTPINWNLKPFSKNIAWSSESESASLLLRVPFNKWAFPSIQLEMMYSAILVTYKISWCCVSWVETCTAYAPSVPACVVVGFVPHSLGLNDTVWHRVSLE